MIEEVTEVTEVKHHRTYRGLEVMTTKNYSLILPTAQAKTASPIQIVGLLNMIDKRLEELNDDLLASPNWIKGRIILAKINSKLDKKSLVLSLLHKCRE